MIFSKICKYIRNYWHGYYYMTSIYSTCIVDSTWFEERYLLGREVMGTRKLGRNRKPLLLFEIGNYYVCYNRSFSFSWKWVFDKSKSFLSPSISLKFEWKSILEFKNMDIQNQHYGKIVNCISFLFHFHQYEMSLFRLFFTFHHGF